MEAEAMEECGVYLFVASGFLSLLSYTIQDHKPSYGITHNGLALPYLSLTKKKKKNYRFVYSPVL